MTLPSPLKDKAIRIETSSDMHKTLLGIEIVKYTTLYFSSGPSEQRRVIYNLHPRCVDEQGKVLAKYAVEGYSRQDHFPVREIPNIDTVMQLADSPLREELERWIQ